MTKKHLKVLSLCLAMISAIQAQTPLDGSRVLEFKISRAGLTRLSILNDSIEDVYAFPAEGGLVTHHKSGHVFIAPDELDTPLYITVITSKGIAQDLRLTPQAKKAEPILLEYREPEPSAQQLRQRQQETCLALLSELVRGKIPPDFLPAPVAEVARGQGPVTAILERGWHNTQFRILVFKIKNESPETQTLDNQVFWSQGDLASAFDRNVIGAEETARLFVIQPYL